MLVLGMSLALLALLPVIPISHFIPIASAHAVLVRSDPAAHAMLQIPPSQVPLWFDDDLVPATSHVTVQDAASQVVDHRDSHVSRSDAHEMIVTLTRLRPGTYTVIWVAQSTDDGHVTEGSFIFRIAGSGGTVPSAPRSGTNIPRSVILDGPTIVQTLATWLALLFLTYWAGGLIWETWVLTPGTPRDPDLAAAATMAARRFRRLVPYMLGLMLVADGGIVLGQGAELAGGWSGAFAPSLLQAILFGSRFGLFWWMRQGVVLAGLGLTLLANWRGWSMWHVGSQAPTRVPAIDTEPRAIPVWWCAVLKTLRGIPRLPAQLLAGWRRRSWLGRIELLLGAALLGAFALSGHAAAVPTPELGYSLSVDLLHLLGNAVWAGGLLYIGFVIVPVLSRLSIRQHARVLALGLPAFSVLATVSVVVLAATGSLNATIRLTSWQQFLTTPYGWILVVKIEFFLLMVLLSVYHAFYLRPRLAQALTSSEEVVVGTPGQALVGVGHASAARTAQATNNAPCTDDVAGDRDEEAVSERAQHLAERLEGWLRREAMLGVAVLFCVALLGAFAGTLAPPL